VSGVEIAIFRVQEFHGNFMVTGVKIFKVERESALGAMHLVKSLPGHLPRSHPLAPVQAYFDAIQASGKRTQRVNLERASRHLGGHGLDYQWSELRSSHLAFLKGTLVGEGYAPSTINATISALRGVALWAWQLGQMSHEDYENLRLVKLVRRGEERRRPARALSFGEVSALFAACESEQSLCSLRDACLLALLYAGGLRREEAIELELSNYNRRTHTLSVMGKGKKPRSVYFHPGGARRAIHAWIRARGLAEGPLMRPVVNNKIVFRQLSPTGLYMACKRRAEKAGVPHFTPHDLRRSLGTHLRDKHVDIDLIRQLLGHSDVRTTQVYLITSERQKRDASMKISVDYRAGRRGSKRRKGRRHSSWRSQLKAKLK
jgi:integrase/recombinase XerD